MKLCCYNIVLNERVYILCCHIVVTMKSYSVTLDAYGTVEKEVRDGGNSGRVFVPKAWIGKKVRIYLVEPVEEGDPGA